MRLSAVGRLLIQSVGIGNNGVSDWITQRISGVIVGSYALFIVSYLVLHPGLEYIQWSELFSASWMKVFTLLCLITLCQHAWIGMWTTGTDYLRPHTAGKYADTMRLIYQVFTLALLLLVFVWGIWILWGK